MKKQLPPVATIGIIALVAIVVLGLGYSWFQKMSGAEPEDPRLAQKQLEMERARRPGGGGDSSGQAPAINPGFSPGTRR